jgi:hypothetical protein
VHLEGNCNSNRSSPKFFGWTTPNSPDRKNPLRLVVQSSRLCVKRFKPFKRFKRFKPFKRFKRFKRFKQVAVADCEPAVQQ